MRIVALFIFIILLTLTGIGIWNLYMGQVRVRDSVQGTSMITNEKNARELHELLTEHTALLSVHLEYVYDEKDSQTTKDQLSYNTQKIATMIEDIGSKEDRGKFISLFERQINEYEAYTHGLKEKDQGTMDSAKIALTKISVDFGKLMNKMSPSIQDKRGEELLLQHITLTLAIVDAHAQKDSGKKLLLMRDANLHANAFADEWAKSIEIEGDL